MYVLRSMADIIVSSWLWHFTWGWLQVILNFFLMWFFLRIVSDLRFLRAGLMSLMAHVCTSAVFSLFVITFFVHILGYRFDEHDQYMVVYQQQHLVSLLFSIVYGALLYAFFIIQNQKFGKKIPKALTVIVLSCTLSGLLAPLIIQFYWHS